MSVGARQSILVVPNSLEYCTCHNADLPEGTTLLGSELVTFSKLTKVNSDISLSHDRTSEKMDIKRDFNMYEDR